MIDRRTCLALCASAISVAVLGCQKTLLPSEASPDEEQSGESGRGVLGVPNRTRALGRAYLFRLQRMPSTRELSAEIGALTAAVAHGERILAVRRQVESDFVEGRTVNVSGWLLAETEARLSALVALEAP